MNSMDDSDQVSDSVIEGIGKTPPINIEVAYALPERQYLVGFQVRQGTTAMAAVLTSGVTSEFPDLDITRAKMGIFSRPLDGRILPLPQDYELQDKDRVEIYRPLQIDPKEARKQRAQEARQKAGIGREAKTKGKKRG